MKRKDRVSGLVILSCLATSFLFLGYDAGIASAQVLYGSIVGTVTDQANAVVPKTVVTSKNTSTGLSRQVTADDSGYYSITNLPEGTYDLSVSAAGFRPLTQKGVNVLINNVARIDLSLEDEELVILGTEYAGEMKKGVFTVVNYFAPKRGLLSMHSFSAEICRSTSA